MSIFSVEKRWSCSVAEALFADERVRDAHDRRLPTLLTFFEAGNAQGLWAFRFGLLLITFSPWWTFQGLRIFPTLPLEKRSAMLNALLEHRFYAVRELVFMVKMSISMMLLGDAQIRARTHYDTQTWEREPVHQSGSRKKLRLVRPSQPHNDTVVDDDSEVA